MRTKSLVCAAVLAAGVVTSMGQVFSQNIVGYANVNVHPGFNMVANPFNNGSNGADVVLPGVPDNCQVTKWNGVGFDLWSYDSGFGGWIDAGFNPSVPTLPPGTGFYYYNPGTAAVLTFTGNVAGNAGETVANSIGAGFQAVGSKVPFSGAVDSASMNLPIQDNMQVLQWNGSTGYNLAGYDSGFGGWIDGGFNTIPAPTVALGEGFFYYNPGTAVNWYQTVPAN